MLTKRDLLRSAAMTTLAVMTAKSTPAVAQNKAEWPSLLEAKDIAEEGFIYGLPLVMYYAVMQEFAVDKNSGQFKAPFNEIYSMHHVATPEDTAVITPNSDTPYSFLWLDVRAEPMVVSVPAVEKDRYYAVQLDRRQHLQFRLYRHPRHRVRARRLSGRRPRLEGRNARRDQAGIPVDDAFPARAYPHTALQPRRHAERRENPGRIQGAAAFAFLKQPPPPAAPTIDFLPATTAGIKDNFFQYLDAALQFVPETARDKAIRAKLARIGVGPGKTFDFKELSLEHKAEILVGMKQGDDKVDKWLAGGNKNINGWNVGSFFGDEAFYNGDWVMRAGAAKGGLLGNDAVEAMYPYTRTDATGETLDGSKHNYTITFAPGQLPPVNAFWSVTMYDGKSQLLVKNPINRYLINSPMLSAMKKDADGSLTLYIQKDNPGADKEANWLPAPDDKIYLVMRLYWPKPTPPSILPPGNGTWQPPGVKRVS